MKNLKYITFKRYLVLIIFGILIINYSMIVGITDQDTGFEGLKNNRNLSEIKTEPYISGPEFICNLSNNEKFYQNQIITIKLMIINNNNISRSFILAEINNSIYEMFILDEKTKEIHFQLDSKELGKFFLHIKLYIYNSSLNLSQTPAYSSIIHYEIVEESFNFFNLFSTPTGMISTILTIMCRMQEAC